MLKQLLQRKVVSDKNLARFCATCCSLVAVLVFVSGFLRLEHLDLTEAQLYTATIETQLLTAAFIGLALLFHRWRKAD